MWRKGTSYRYLDSKCVFNVRALDRSRGAGRLIARRRRHRPAAGFVFESSAPLEPGTLVEIDMEFPEQSRIYRTVGIVAWTEKHTESEHTREIGVSIFQMSKPDLKTIPVSEDKRSLSPDPAPRESTVESPEQADDTSAPLEPGGVPSSIQADDSDDLASPLQATPPKPISDAEQPTGNKTEVKDPEPDTLNLPDSNDIAELLSGLLGDTVTAKPAAAAPMNEDEIAVVGEYVDDTGTVTAFCLIDLDLSVFMGAAIVMIPKDVAYKNIENATLSEEIHENLAEILNIAASLFNKNHGAHQKFERLHLGLGEPLSMEVRSHLKDTPKRVDFELKIPDYGSGRMSFIVTKAE